MPRALRMLRKDLRRPQGITNDSEVLFKQEVKAKAELSTAWPSVEGSIHMHTEPTGKELVGS